MPDLSMSRGMAFSGGGGGSTSSTSLPDWYKPYVEKAAGTAVTAYDQGLLGQVASFNPLQQQATNAQITAANSAAGNYDAAAAAANQIGGVAQYGYNTNIQGVSPQTSAIKQAATDQARKAWAPTGDSLASRGQIGGARDRILRNDRDNQLANTFAQIDRDDYLNRQQASTQAAQQSISNAGALNQLAYQPTQGLTAAGGAIQQQQQAQLDAPYTGLARLGGLLSGAPSPGSNTTTTGGGGK